MQTSEREQFEQELARLCAGYGKPATKAQQSAYWSGLGKMGLVQFIRCVDHALGEEGPEDLPNVKALWRIHRSFRAAAPRARSAGDADKRDHLLYWLNRMLWVHIRARGGLGSTGTFIPSEYGKSGMNDCIASRELEACQKLKRELIAWFSGPIREGDPDATPAEVMRQWIAGLQACSRIEPETYRRWCEMVERPEYQQPFEPWMGRELPVETREEVAA